MKAKRRKRMSQAHAVAVDGLIIFTPGSHYHFDDKEPVCPMCTSMDVRYHGWIDDPETVGHREGSFTCRNCTAEFHKTRTKHEEPVGYTQPRIEQDDEDDDC